MDGNERRSERTELVDLTPFLALRLLQNLAPYQRPLDKAHITRLARMMTSGLWIWNGDTIKIDVNGQCGDGQHRLHAVVQSGVTLRGQAIAYGVSEAANGTIDTMGKPRSAAQVARARQRSAITPNNSLLAAAAYEHCNFDAWAISQTTRLERVILFEELPAQLQVELHKLEGLVRGRRFNRRGALAACLRCMRANERAMPFFQLALVNQAECDAGRALFSKLATMDPGRRGEEKDSKAAWCVMRAFAAYLHGERLSLLRAPTDWDADRRSLEAFGIPTTRSL